MCAAARVSVVGWVVFLMWGSTSVQVLAGEASPQTRPSEALPPGDDLARQVVARVNQTQYNVRQHGIEGFEAIYALEKKGKKVATIEVTYGPDTKGHCRLIQKASNGMDLMRYLDEDLLNDMDRALAQAVLPWTEEGVKSKQEGRVVRLHYPPRDNWRKDVYVRAVDKNNCCTAESVWAENQPGMEITFQFQEREGKRYLQKAQFERRVFGEMRPRTTELTLTYFPAEGIPFVQILDRGDNLTTVSFEKATFKRRDGTVVATTRRPAAAGTGAEPRVDTGNLPRLPDVDAPQRRGAGPTPVQPTMNWDETSAALIPKLVDANFDNGDVLRVVRKASCTLDVTITAQGFAPMRGRIAVFWEDVNDDGVLSDAEISVEPEAVSDATARALVREICDGMRPLLQRSMMGTALSSSLRTTITDEGYLMTVVPTKGNKDPGIEAKVTITRDLQPVRVETTVENKDDRKESVKVVTKLHYVKTGQKWIADEIEEVVGGRAGTVVTRQRFGYEAIEGVPMVTRVASAKTVGSFNQTYTIRQDYVARDWKLTKREKPLELDALLSRPVAGRTENPVLAGATLRPIPDVRIPKTTEARDLAARTVKSLIGRYYLIWMRDVTAFEAVYSVRRDGAAVGKVKLEGALSPKKLDATAADIADRQTRRYVETAATKMLGTVMSPPISIQNIDKGLYAATDAAGTFIDVTEQAPPRAKARQLLIVIPADMKTVRNAMVLDSGACQEIVCEAEELEGKLHVTSLDIFAYIKDKVLEREHYKIRHEPRDGHQFPVDITLLSGNELPGTWTFKLEQVKFTVDRPEQTMEELERELQQDILESLRRQLEQRRQGN